MFDCKETFVVEDLRLRLSLKFVCHTAEFMDISITRYCQWRRLMGTQTLQEKEEIVHFSAEAH